MPSLMSLPAREEWIMELTRESFHAEGTGGGCSALVRYLEDGRVLVLTDGNLGVDFALSEWSGDSACGVIYRDRASWEDSGDEAGILQDFGAAHLDALLEQVNAAL